MQGGETLEASRSPKHSTFGHFPQLVTQPADNECVMCRPAPLESESLMGSDPLEVPSQQRRPISGSAQRLKAPAPNSTAVGRHVP
jgi:hypothetical protein